MFKAKKEATLTKLIVKVALLICIYFVNDCNFTRVFSP